MTDPVTEFEKRIAEFFGAPYGVATDSCTHAIELGLRFIKADMVHSPKRTYLSIPMLANKLGVKLLWMDLKWEGWYVVCAMPNSPFWVVDAAILWERDSYHPRTFMCVSFQHQKHLSLGRGGMILTDDKEAAIQLKKMSYDGREPNIPWREQNIDTFGYHYYMTPETAQLGLDKLDEAIRTEPRKWTSADYPLLTEMEIFK